MRFVFQLRSEKPFFVESNFDSEGHVSKPRTICGCMVYLNLHFAGELKFKCL